ncbi:MAG: hypothetical protein VB066_08295 [Paludibacter sp.]|nr:hypothetical protein [Paludibacter sp.]
MKTLLTTLLLILTCITHAVAQQKLHTPAEILKMMSDSKLMYEVKMLDKPVTCPDYSNKLNSQDSYRVYTDSGFYTSRYEINDKARPLLDQAEAYFKSNNRYSALMYYRMALEADSTQYYILTYIGQMYDGQRDYTNSIEWYKKAISKNYIDYMAHWFLADAYFAIGEVDSAVDEIVIARILNRNNPRLADSMNRIFKKAKRNTNDWCFNPQIAINKGEGNRVIVEMSADWTAYAMAKALWNFEPGYKESMGVAPDNYSTIEEKECLFALLVGMENAKTSVKNNPQLMILKKATDNNHLEDYMLYEVFLPRSPQVAYQLSEQAIQSIKNYVLNVRNTK